MPRRIIQVLTLALLSVAFSTSASAQRRPIVVGVDGGFFYSVFDEPATAWPDGHRRNDRCLIVDPLEGGASAGSPFETHHPFVVSVNAPRRKSDAGLPLGAPGRASLAQGGDTPAGRR